MTREELKTHCEKEIEMCEFWARCKGEDLNNSKIYQEHKLVLELLEQELVLDKIKTEIKENTTALEKWKNDFKGFISKLSMPEDDFYGIMQYIDEVPNEVKQIIDKAEGSDSE